MLARVLETAVCLSLLMFVSTCSNPTDDQASTGKLAGTVSGAGVPVAGATISVMATDGTINVGAGESLITDEDGRFDILLISPLFSMREVAGDVRIEPPASSSLPDTTIAGVVLRTGPTTPTAILDVELLP